MNFSKYVLTGIIVTALICSPAAAAEVQDSAEKTDAIEKQSAETVEKKEAEEALSEWFKGHPATAEKKLSALVGKNTENPVVWQALAILLSDKGTAGDYARITRIYNEHRVKLIKHPEYYPALSPMIKKYAEAGSTAAQFLYARTAQMGLSGSFNPAAPMLMMRRASDGGYAQATRELGLMYETGNLLEKDPVKAAKLYQKAVNLGDVYAMKFLATLHINKVLPENREKVRKLLTDASEAGLPEAQLTLAQMYNFGIGIEKDEKKAFRWFKKAAENGSSSAMNALATAYNEGKFVSKNAREEIRWLKTAAENGDSDALFKLGVYSYSGKKMKKDIHRAFNYFEKSAHLGQPTAWYNLGIMYRNGDGVKKDVDKARSWFERAALIGDYKAQFNLGVIYAEGDGVKKNLEQSAYWFYLSKLCGNSNTEKSIVYLRQNGLTAQDEDYASRHAERTFKQLKKFTD